MLFPNHLQFLESRKLQIPFCGELVFRGENTRKDFMKTLYAALAVDASEFSAHCADKLLFTKWVESIRFSPTANGCGMPKTKSLKELLPNLKENLEKEFHHPVIKPVASMGSDGKGIYFSAEEFLQDFEKRPEYFFEEEISPLTGLLSSGEKYFVQEKIGSRDQEYRLHTYQGSVVKGATFTRWDQDWDLKKFEEAEEALQQFLNTLPSWFTAGQAWSVDLMEGDPGFSVVEINTNRGRKKHWSGDLTNPDTLAAYAKHFQEFYGAKFTSEGAKKILRGESKLEDFVEKFGWEAVKKHQELRKSLKL